MSPRSYPEWELIFLIQLRQYRYRYLDIPFILDLNNDNPNVRVGHVIVVVVVVVVAMMNGRMSIERVSILGVVTTGQHGTLLDPTHRHHIVLDLFRRLWLLLWNIVLRLMFLH